MRSSRIRIQVAVLLFILLPASVGVLAVHASATCERFVRTYVTKPIRNRVSKQTADAWSAWRVAHPDWKPNPKNRRPKYVMTRDEAIQKVNFACSVETSPTDLDLFFTPADMDGPPAPVELPAMTTELKLPPVPNANVVEIAVNLPPVPLATVPVVNVLAAGPVPEPGSWLMVGSGILSLGFLFRARTLRGRV